MVSSLFIIKFSFTDSFICQAYTCKQAIEIADNVLKSFKKSSNKSSTAKIYKHKTLIATIK